MSIDPPVYRSGVNNTKNILLIFALSAVYLLISFLLIGFRFEQILLVFLFNLLYFISVPTRKFILAFSIFILYWIVFDYMKAFPNYHYMQVHIGDLYATEK